MIARLFFGLFHAAENYYVSCVKVHIISLHRQFTSILKELKIHLVLLCMCVCFCNSYPSAHIYLFFYLLFYYYYYYHYKYT